MKILKLINKNLLLLVLLLLITRTLSQTDARTTAELQQATRTPNTATIRSTFCSNNCQKCNFNLNICEECGEKYYWDHNYKICVQGLIPGCKIYRSESMCSVCETGYRNIRGICTRCQMARCGDCNSSINSCNQCKRGFAFSGSSSNGSNCDLICQVQNCENCFNGNGNFCRKCLPGYRNTVSNSCEKCEITGCAECPTSKSVCNNGKCLDGFYWFNNACVACVTGCLRCGRNGECAACDVKNGFYMSRELVCVKLFGKILNFSFIGLVLFWVDFG